MGEDLAFSTLVIGLIVVVGALAWDAYFHRNADSRDYEEKDDEGS